jgi:hypothetical protein
MRDKSPGVRLAVSGRPHKLVLVSVDLGGSAGRAAADNYGGTGDYLQ